MSPSRAVVRYFVSYAHTDDRLKRALLERLHTRLSIATGFSFQPWDDQRLLVGQEWSAGILAAIGACDFGLLLLSPEFLASPYIRGVELPALVSGKRLVPVELKPLRFDGSMDMAGLDRLQIFPGPLGKAFSTLRSSAAQDKFADDLFAQIVQIARAGFPPVP